MVDLFLLDAVDPIYYINFPVAQRVFVDFVKSCALSTRESITVNDLALIRSGDCSIHADSASVANGLFPVEPL